MVGADDLAVIKRRLAVVLLCVLGLLVAAFGGLRAVIVRPVTCVPNCIGENLLRSNLHGLNLAHTNFVEANLQNANLSGANLQQVDLSGANLLNANLQNANLNEAQLIGANLTGANLGGSSFSGANLTGAILDQADLTAVDLSEARLQGASFRSANLTNVRLRQAKLSGIQFTKANLSGAYMDEASLSGANLSQADLSGAHLRRADLTGAWLNLANLTGADLHGADLLGSRLIGAQLASTNLAESRLQGAVVIGATFNGANVYGADLRQLRDRAEQLTADDLRLDPVLAELNELQQRDLRQDVKLQGLAYNALTQWDSPLQPTTTSHTGNADAPAALAAGVVAPAGALSDTISSAQHLKLNFFINRLRPAPGQPGAYELDFYLDAFWQEPTLTDAPLTAAATTTFFDPALEVVNSSQVQQHGRFYERSVEPGVNLRLRQRLTGIFTPKLDLLRFPFDQQVVSFQIESAAHDSERLLLDFTGLVEPIVQSEIPYTMAVSRGRHLDASAVDPEWQVQAITIGQLIRVLPYDNSAWSQLRVDLTVQRVATGYIWRIWAIVVCLWLLPSTVLLIDSRALPIRLWVLFLLCWIVVAFQAILTRMLPWPTAFTLLDLALLLCYAAIAGMALLVLAVQLFRRWERPQWERWVNGGYLLFYPILLVIINIWLLSNAL